MSLKLLIYLAKFGLYNWTVLSKYSELRKQQYLSLDELYQLNWEKRKRILSFAFENVPFYRSRFSSIGLHPNDIKTPEEFQQVPVLTKRDLRGHFEQLISENVNRKYSRISTTGGSTGVPTKVFHDKRFPLEALRWRMLSWWEVHPSSDMAIIYRLTDQSRDSILKKILLWPTKQLYLDASSMSHESISNFLTNYNVLKPDVVLGYTGSVDHVAQFIRNNKINIHKPKAVWVTSSPITNLQRKRIEEVFSAPVYNQYGCGEVHWLSAQCKERGGLHVFIDSRHIECIDANGKSCPVNQIGDILVTDLDNYAFPLIRYAVGDRGRMLDRKCPCGVNLPLMDEVKGRTTEMVKLSNGTILSGDYLTTIFDDFPDEIEQFQVLQNSHSSLEIKFVAHSNADNLPTIIDIVYNKLIIKIGSEIKINMIQVENIPHDRGKNRFVICDLDYSSDAALTNDTKSIDCCKKWK